MGFTVVFFRHIVTFKNTRFGDITGLPHADRKLARDSTIRVFLDKLIVKGKLLVPEPDPLPDPLDFRRKKNLTVTLNDYFRQGVYDALEEVIVFQNFLNIFFLLSKIFYEII